MKSKSLFQISASMPVTVPNALKQASHRVVLLTFIGSLSASVALFSTAAAAVEPGSTVGKIYPPAAAPFEGVWLIDAKASGLPGDGNNPPQLTATAAQARKMNQELRAKGDSSFDLSAHCSNPGVPRVMSVPSPIRIFARADDVTIMFEWNHLLRQIHVDGKEHEVPYTTAAGVSSGKWEDGKLIVNTIGRNDKTLLDDSIHNSESLTVAEVFSASKDGKTLSYTVTMEDPEVLAAPWTRHYVFHKQQGYVLKDDVCLDRVEAGKLSLPKGY